MAFLLLYLWCMFPSVNKHNHT